VSPQAVHKTEVGGVALDITSEDAAVAAAQEMEARLRAADPDAEIDGFMVQQMVDGLEVIAGVRDDPQFGPVLALGFGGVLVEAIGDVSFRLLPVTAADVADMLGDLRAKALLGSFRGAPARDVDALAHCAVALSNAYLDLRGEVSDIEINPLMVGAVGEGVCAVDIRAIRRERDD
jgi:succinyl-CoA synthetase beta subunit